MDFSRGPGWIVSALAHGTLLAGVIVVMPDAKTVTDAQETVPVEFVTETEFNEVMKGSRTASPDVETPPADKVADEPEPAVEPPVGQATRDTPSPPPPPEPPPAEPTVAEAPPPPPAPLPPSRPALQPPPEPAPKPAPEPAPKPAPEPAPTQARAPEPAQVAETPAPEAPAPVPPRRPRDLPRDPPRAAEPAPQPAQQRPDRIAGLIERQQREEAARRPPARPQRPDDSAERKRNFDRDAISRLLSREPPERRGSAGPQPQQSARLGSPTATGSRMSPSMWGQLDGLMQEQYKRCWSYLGLASGQRYVPQVRVAYTTSGSLAGEPQLLNPPSDPALRGLADSALRAVRRCDPLRIPERFAPYYDQWKGRILRFDPEEMLR